jgi:hypothetical protein
MHEHPTRPIRRARLLSAAVTLAAAAMMAACSSSSPKGSAAPTSSSARSDSGSQPSSSTLAFSKCMRANGLPNFPDLGGSGMRIEGTGQALSVNGVLVNAPAYRAARQACEKYMPHSQATPAQAAQQRQRGLEFARCMRSHGVPNFPDPRVISSSGGNQQVYLPGINPQSPAFQAGAKACGGGPKGP